ncbi:hypothetical protein Kirov_138 [Bacillus phage Kirov]|uniref:Uncharacterized protein n=1 Tax=Bacillus phage Kirov TaxID=2783539 RepID=A0A7U3NJW0_9CAUD|nr:hypothetical protein PQE67_gp166 [Bacillus phage Kirov]QOV08337.1 hypothetical protein Kirov_138 [Bacillus phage Kirov]
MSKKADVKFVQGVIGEEGIDQMLNIVNVVSVWSDGKTMRRYVGQNEKSTTHKASEGYRKMVAIIVEVKDDEPVVEGVESSIK